MSGSWEPAVGAFARLVTFPGGRLPRVQEVLLPLLDGEAGDARAAQPRLERRDGERPDSGGPVRRGGDGPLTVRAEGGGEDRALVPSELQRLLSPVDPPDP